MRCSRDPHAADRDRCAQSRRRVALGIYCTVELHIPRKTPGLIVPADAIIFNADGLQVAVVDKGIVRFRNVTVTRDFGTTVEVNDALRPGDEVIFNPPVDLAEGSRVEAQAEAPPPTS